MKEVLKFFIEPRIEDCKQSYDYNNPEYNIKIVYVFHFINPAPSQIRLKACGHLYILKYNQNASYP